MRDLERVGRVPDELPRSRGPSCVVVPRPLQGGGTFAAASIYLLPAKSQAPRDMQPLLQGAGWQAQMQHGWFMVKNRFSCRTPR